MPTQVRFQRKCEIALSQLDDALEWGVRKHVVLADAGYGDAREFREGVRARGLHYLMGVQGAHRVERDYQEMKGEVGLDHFEGRTWRGFHPHATLCMVAHGFLALRRALFPPEQEALDAA